jgi:hypothetical protein
MPDTYTIALAPTSGVDGNLTGKGSVFNYTVSRTGSLGASSVGTPSRT